MRSARSLGLLICAGLGAFALAACSGGGNPDGSMGGDGSNNGGDATDGTVVLPDGNTVDVSTPHGTWTTATSGTTQDIRMAWGSGPSDVYAVSSRQLLRYTGSAWSAADATLADGMTPIVLAAVGGTAMNNVWVLGITIPPNGSAEMGHLVFEHDTGSGFMDDVDSLLATFGAMHFESASNAWAVGIMGTAAHFDGTAWTASMNGIPSTESLSAIYTISATDAVAVGDHVFRWNGTTWAMQPQANMTQDHVWYGVWASGPNDVWVVGQSAFIQHWDGSSWVDVDPGSDSSGGVLSGNLYGVWGAAPNDVWAVGEGGTIIHYNGVAWSLYAGGGGAGPTMRPLHGVWGSSANDIWAVGDTGTILHYH